MSYYQPTDIPELTAWRDWLTATASAAGRQVGDVGGVASGAGQAGDGTAVDSLRAALGYLEDRLRNVQSNLQRAGAVMSTLVMTLEELGTEAERRFQSYGSPQPWTPHYVQWETFGEPWRESHSADSARSRASSELQAIAQAAPNAPHSQSVFRRFLRDLESGGSDLMHAVASNARQEFDLAESLGQKYFDIEKDIATDLAGEVAGLGVLGWDLLKANYRLNPTLNPTGFVQAWEGYVQGARNLYDHRSQVWHGLVDGIIDRKMFDKDKIGWAVVLAVNIVGPKGLGKLGELARAGEGAEGLAEGERGAEGLAKAAGSERALPAAGKAGTTAQIARLADRGTADNFLTEPFDPKFPPHTLDRHLIAKDPTPASMQQLHEQNVLRSTRPRPYEGVWNSKQVADEELRTFFNDYGPEVQKFVDSDKAFKPYTFRATRDIGQTWEVGANRLEPSPYVRVYLRSCENSPGGFYVESMYPAYPFQNFILLNP